MRSERGFTLIELLVVIAIIGILAAIAIPEFSEYRKRSFDSRAFSDGRNLLVAEEAYFVDWEVYSEDLAALPGAALSEGVVAHIYADPSGMMTGQPEFEVDICHPKGTQWYRYHSTTIWGGKWLNGSNGYTFSNSGSCS